MCLCLCLCWSRRLDRFYFMMNAQDFPESSSFETAEVGRELAVGWGKHDDKKTRQNSDTGHATLVVSFHKHASQNAPRQSQRPSPCSSSPPPSFGSCSAPSAAALKLRARDASAQSKNNDDGDNLLGKKKNFIFTFFSLPPFPNGALLRRHQDSQERQARGVAMGPTSSAPESPRAG